MERVLKELRRAFRRARKLGAKVTYEITIEWDGIKCTYHSKKEAASGQADDFERGVIR